MRGSRRVVITGAGALTPLGNSASTFWNALIAGDSGIRTHPAPEISTPVGWVDFNFNAYFSRMQMSTLDRVSQMAMVAGDEAVASAGLGGIAMGPRGGVLFGTGMGGAESLEAGYARFFGVPTTKRKVLTVLAAMTHSASAQIAIRFKAQGECQNYSTGCSSSAVAIGEAYRRIRDGYLDVALAGGVECLLVPGVIDSWKAMKVMCEPPADAPGTGCRPFSADRNGFALGEGAAVLVLETLERAVGRAAQPLCEIIGYGVSNDATHITNPDAEGQSRAMAMALSDAAVDAFDIDHVNAHGTATRAGDLVETASLKRTLGEHAYRIPVSATKSAHGHLMGATAAVELVAAVCTLQHQVVPPTTHWRKRDPECDLDYVPGRGRAADVQHVLFNSFAFGGNNVSIVLRRWQ
jgi:3-oxoacyl-(acyl-carrier-protein) synthase